MGRDAVLRDVVKRDANHDSRIMNRASSGRVAGYWL
jgi:hypothetical protein